MQDSVSEEYRALWERQLSGNTQKTYPDALRTFAVTLHFHSSAAYDYVRKTFMNSLPHPSTIRRWYQHLHGSPGITKEAITTLNEKIKTVSLEDKCLFFNLVADEMSLKKCVELDGDQYIGMVDIGANAEANDTLPEAEHALVFLVTCINMHFKIPVAYYFISGLSGKERANLLKQCLIVLHENNIKIVSVTTDGTSVNISMFEQLGAILFTNSAKNIVPFFPHPVTNEQIYIFLDAVHMIKLIRNCLGTKKILYNHEGKVIRWSYLEQLVAVQEEEGLHAATKIRRRHLQWQKEKMKVKLATQTFSKSVADALSFCREDLQLPKFAGSGATSRFCIEINNMFDLLNSRNLICKSKSKRCISVENLEEMKTKVESYCAFLENIQDEKGPILQSRTKTGFLGLIVCLKNSITLAESLFATKKIKFLMTYKLSQDHLETFFSAVRRRGGFNNNPSCKQFKTAYKKLMMYVDPTLSHSANIIKMDSTKILQTNYPRQLDLIATCSINENGIDSIIDDIEYDKQTKSDDDTELLNIWLSSEYAEDVVAYIAGFIVRRLMKVIKYDFCSLALMGKTPKSKLQSKKSEGGLISASDDVIQTCISAEYVVRTYPNLYTEKNVISKMVQLILSTIPEHVFDNVAHMTTKAPLSDCRFQLLKAIAERYCKLRLHHEGVSRQQSVERVRSLFTKYILFKHQ